MNSNEKKLFDSPAFFLMTDEEKEQLLKTAKEYAATMSDLADRCKDYE